MTVAEAGSMDLVVAFPDEPLYAALTKMLERDVGRLPVVERNNPGRVVGYLGRAAILSARMKFHEEENIRQRGSFSGNGQCARLRQSRQKLVAQMLVFLKRSVHHVHLHHRMAVTDPTRHGAHMLAINQHCHSQGFNDLLEKTAILWAVRSWLWNLRAKYPAIREGLDSPTIFLSGT